MDTELRRKLEFTDPQSTTFGLSEQATNVALPFEITPGCFDETLKHEETDMDLSTQTKPRFNFLAHDTKPVSAFNSTFCSLKRSTAYLTPPRASATVKRLEIDEQSSQKKAFCKNITIEMWKTDKNYLSNNQDQSCDKPTV